MDVRLTGKLPFSRVLLICPNGYIRNATPRKKGKRDRIGYLILREQPCLQNLSLHAGTIPIKNAFFSYDMCENI